MLKIYGAPEGGFDLFGNKEMVKDGLSFFVVRYYLFASFRNKLDIVFDFLIGDILRAVLLNEF